MNVVVVLMTVLVERVAMGAAAMSSSLSMLLLSLRLATVFVVCCVFFLPPQCVYVRLRGQHTRQQQTEGYSKNGRGCC